MLHFRSTACYLHMASIGTAGRVHRESLVVTIVFNRLQKKRLTVVYILLGSCVTEGFPRKEEGLTVSVYSQIHRHIYVYGQIGATHNTNEME